MYQPTKAYQDVLTEVLRAYEPHPERIAAKIPITQADLSIAAKLVRQGVPVALTAALTSRHMLICEAIGGKYLIPYVDRAARDPRSRSDLVREMVLVRRGPVVIVAASIKSATLLRQPHIDIAGLAMSLGVGATVVRSTDELAGALRARDRQAPTLLDVRMSEDDRDWRSGWLVPPHDMV